MLDDSVQDPCWHVPPEQKTGRLEKSGKVKYWGLWDDVFSCNTQLQSRRFSFEWPPAFAQPAVVDVLSWWMSKINEGIWRVWNDWINKDSKLKGPYMCVRLLSNILRLLLSYFDSDAGLNLIRTYPLCCCGWTCCPPSCWEIVHHNITQENILYGMPHIS